MLGCGSADFFDKRLLDFLLKMLRNVMIDFGHLKSFENVYCYYSTCQYVRYADSVGPDEICYFLVLLESNLIAQTRLKHVNVCFTPPYLNSKTSRTRGKSVLLCSFGGTKVTKSRPGV